MATKSEGICRFCLQTISGAGMSKHLAACKDKKEKDVREASAAKGKSSILYFEITGYSYFHDAPYWLHIEMNDAAKLYELDQFLRGIWLECCGHLSEFTINGERYSDSPGDDFFDFEELKSESTEVALKKLFGPATRFEYVYDFGSSSELAGQVMKVRPGKIKGDSVRILARNNPYHFECNSCGKAAANYCAECDSFYCQKCLKKHECGEDMALPVVNSPRMGICGYTGEYEKDKFMWEHFRNPDY